MIVLLVGQKDLKSLKKKLIFNDFVQLNYCFFFNSNENQVCVA